MRKKKREQIGSHRLFEALIANDQSWAIWREPTEREQDEIADNRWAGDPLDTFRLYCETKEAFDELSDTNRRPLNFTPANAKYSRRLFIFSDVCSFPGPEFRHDPDELAVTVPLAVANSDGRFQRHRARLSYRAPRLLRDQLRGIDGKLGKAWLQPMIAALGLSEGVAEEQDISDAAVQLMPDFPRDRGQRFLLNFPLDLSPVARWRRVYELRNQSEFFATRFAKIDKKKDKPLHGGIWEANLRTFWEGSSPKKRDTLFWPSDEPALPEWCPHRWWEKLSSFRVLGADLGTRHGASVALVEASALSREETPDECSRFIGEANGRKWHARFRTGKILRLAGEDAAVFRHRTKQDLANHSKSETNRPDIDLREELHGSRGRLADRPECEETLRTLRQFGQLELVPEECRGCNDDATLREAAAILRPLLSFPEQNDKLLIAIRRTQGLIADLISMHWRLVNPEEPEQKTKALAEIQEQERYPEWHEMAHADQPHADLTAKMHAEIASLRRQVQEQLLALTRRILPLRGRDWEWKPYSTEGRFKDCHELRQTMPESDDVNKEEEDSSVKLRGQRGLSMARIEQLGELRRRWQSLNQSLRRQIGQRPLTAAEMRDQLIPDPCPDILKRLGAIREQRVNQIAHMIMAEALGVRTTKHAQTGEDRIRRRAADVHGEYERFRPPVDFIVLEDLSRYLSNQGRAKSENSRLMEWCHRQVNAKVKELAEPFGIPVLETAAAWSSRFCSLSGIAGFRAVEVAPADATEFKWRKLLEEYDEAHEKRAKEGASKESKTSIEARGAHHLFDLLEQINVGREGKYVRTLLAPQPGGPIFVPAYQLHRIPDSQQADINAAINLAFRAIAQPSCAQIHLRLRSERVPAKNKNEHDRFFAREERRFGKGVGIEIVSENGSLPKDRNPNFFFDPHHVATEDRAKLIDGVSDHEADYAPYAPLWGKVNAAAFQWWRCRQFNRHRVEDWKKEAKTA